MIRRRFLSIALAAWACAAMGSANSNQTPQFRAGVDLIHLDVSVLDSERRPVRGLTAADFEIFEDGKLQTLSTFAAVDIPDVVEPSTPWMREVPPDTRRNDTLDNRRLFVMVIDDATAQADVAALKSTKDIARRFIEGLGPTDLMAIVFTLDNRNAQDYTSDRKRLLATVDKFNVGFRDMGDNFLYFRYTVEVLGKVAELLSALPEQRKALVYVGQGVPVDAVAASTVVMTGAGDTESGAKQQLLIRRMREAFRKAERANVTFYTLDTCGLRAGFKPTCGPGLEVDFLRGIATETGGYSTADTNDFEPGIKQIFLENASYYMLGFQSTNANADGKFRRVEVKVKRPGLRVRTRSGYTAEKTADLSDNKKVGTDPEPLSIAISGLLPKKDVPMQAWAAPFAVGGRPESSVPIALAFRLDVPARESRFNETVDLRVDAYTPEGRLKTSQTLRTQLVLRPGPQGQVLYEVVTMVSLPAGRYQLRLAAQLGRLRKSGSVYYDVDVPDVSKGKLTWSGIAFHASPGVTTGASARLQTGIPIVPTSQRLFPATDVVTVFARIHQGGKSALAPVAITASITDSSGREVWKQAQTFAGDRFTTARGADVGLAVPIAQLPPGPYRLRLEATEGKTTVMRDSRFTVR